MFYDLNLEWITDCKFYRLFKVTLCSVLEWIHYLLTTLLWHTYSHLETACVGECSKPVCAHLQIWQETLRSCCCCCSVAKLCLTLCDPMDCSTPDFLSFTISSSLLKLMSIDSVMPSNHLILCHPLLLMPSIFPNVRSLSSESTLHIKVLELQL